MGAYDSYLISMLNDMISELPDVPTMDATALKEWFDKSPVQIKTAFNLFVTKVGQDKDAFEAWKADLEALNMDAGAAAALSAAITATNTQFASHAARHAAGGADAIATDAIPVQDSTKPLQSGGAYSKLADKADLSNGIVLQAQARVKLIEKTASFTLSAAEIEGVVFSNSSSAITVTIPLDSAYNAPAGTCFSFIRWGTGTLTFAKDASANWIPLNNVTAVSVQGGAATLMKISANTWWLSCN